MGYSQPQKRTKKKERCPTQCRVSGTSSGPAIRCGALVTETAPATDAAAAAARVGVIRSGYSSSISFSTGVMVSSSSFSPRSTWSLVDLPAMSSASSRGRS